jgi:aminocarboxymuconate-semialdehyde decarboxylase
MNIDVHTHLFPRPFIEAIAKHGARHGMEVVPGDNGIPVLMMQGVPHPDLRPFIDPEQHFERMAAANIDTHVIWQSSRPNVFWADADLALDLCQINNDEYSRLAERDPDRFIGVASVPLQEMSLALSECERAVTKKRLSGVMTNTNVRGRYLDDPYFWPLYELLEQLDAPLFLHPAHPFGADKLKDFHLSFLLGLPADTTLSVARLIFSGTLDRFPKLRLFVPHGGGLLPFLSGRLDHGFAVRPECRKIERRPVEYLDRMLVDSIVFAPDVLKFVTEKAGPAHVALGSDYPYDMADEDPVGLIHKAGFTPDVAEAIASQNVRSFLRLSNS